MAKTKDLDSYPRAYFDIVEAAYRCEAMRDLPLPDASACISKRHDFNRFRVALTRSGHPQAAAANDLIVRIASDPHRLKFVPAGMWKMELAIEPEIEIEAGVAATPAMPAIITSPAGDKDHSESAVESYLGISSDRPK